MTTTKKNLPAKAVTTAVALPFDYGTDAGRGLDLTLDDLLIPFIKLLQDDSKELDSDEDRYIEGVSKGQILNMATKQAVDGDVGMVLVPAVKRRTFVEFLPDRAGFVAEHEPNSQVVLKAQAEATSRNDLKTKSGNPLVETKSIFAIVLENDVPVGYVVVPFTSSKLSAWNEYWTAVDSMRVKTPNGDRKLTDVAAIWGLRVHLRSKFTKNAKGKFYNYVMSPFGGGVADSLIAPSHLGYQAAKSLAEAVEAGRARADTSTMDEGDRGEKASGDRHF